MQHRSHLHGAEIQSSIDLNEDGLIAQDLVGSSVLESVIQGAQAKEGQPQDD